ncbi:DsrE/DsrF/TusD sulfur relay family protein [Mycobacteroides abscessus]|uniref:DsrE/DsrF/TusD sulfur relay family protein n=2 Tax=Mycobacteroides abscessus TaxID=36809 RepID=UPI0002683732|nr:DsrE family protein [Mycobacteroides abscessus]EIT89189.1 dsrE protein [Mycobacteroides abscessus 4S-0303]EIT91181.1 dsrE protein [Mycobacteroides abscessus 4S-0726-RB]EIT94730.1 dsrE protein [Mycobacteroides abscessus 4S-0726-RA]EIV10215.1 dsrE protein [Mycobacteroides abscessus 4S-0206]EIV48481.1 dsrE protein [Mycobacteroides abscessus 4S-0116-R]
MLEISYLEVRMKFLFVLHDPPYGTERTFNGIRWAREVAGDSDQHEVKVFLFGDAVGAAKAGQSTPNGYYNLASMVRGLHSKGISVGCCGICLDARGLGDDDLVPGSSRSSMAQLAEWTVWADQVINV